MDRDQWHSVLASIKQSDRALGRAKRMRYPCWLIVAMYVWSVAHDRPLCWACTRAHYTRWFRPSRLPSVSQFTRRIKTSRCQAILQDVHDTLARREVPMAISYLDGKPLAVGSTSRDPDARSGRVCGGFAKGYKLHAWVTEDGRIPVWAVCGLNRHEAVVAAEMVTDAPVLSSHALVLADRNYDARRVYEAVALRGGGLLVPPRGFAVHPVALRQMGPLRREALSLWREHARSARSVHRQRVCVEGVFSALCSAGGGLAPLPAWVRRTDRVRRWVGAKIILYHARLSCKNARRRAS
jgi:hypothetical protein